MKFVALLLLVGLIGANAQLDIAVDFLVDNIFQPLLTNLQTNALSLLFGTLNNLIGSIGKRGLSDIKDTLLALFNAHKDKLTALIGQYSSQLISLASNLLGFLGPQRTTKQIAAVKLEANFAEELRILNNDFVHQVVSTLSGYFNHGALMITMQNFNTQLQQLLTGSFDMVTGQLFETLSNIAQQAIPQLQQLQGNVQSQIQQLIQNFDLNGLVNLLG